MELFLPRRCAGCGEPGELLCPRCRQVLASPPQRIHTRVDPHVPVWSFGSYADTHRRVVLAMKERNNLAVRRHVGAVLAAGVRFLAARGELIDAPVLVPAPTRPRNARVRGGDPVTDVCRASGLAVSQALRHRGSVGDQVGLGVEKRRENLSGAVELRGIPRGSVLLVDDVATTGSTLAASSEVLFAAGVTVVGAIVICHA
ncbi:MAG: phosphoribosyltransferase family protein [Corynebacterium sp.]|uniref:ComF family protein n=1 Tax=Corynebacterium sp. TaxID=1720 RepID=UPI0026DF92DA|nr:phosphoribosyltransferase family protein [Corynebacterium sp.]MDO5669429.1 phosphoribosyltransferase family protein [Corynebacterium sp.]